MASILPNGKTQFVDQNGKPLAGGSVTFYIPGTTTKKDTWQDQAMTQPNTNPVVLDSRGQATIWGTDSYRQVVVDQLGAVIWDQVVSEYSGAAQAISSNLANTSDPTLGDALVGVKASISGGVPRTQHTKNADIISLLDVGGVGDWSGAAGTDNSAAIISATTAAAAVYLPPGKFMFTTSAALAAVQKSSMYGPGTLFYSNGGSTTQVGKNFRVGVNNNAANPTMPAGGIVIGGEGPGFDGVQLWGQHPSWMQVQTTKIGGDTELQVYTGAICGLATSVSGSNVISATYNDFSSTRIEVGDIIGFGNREYKIASKPTSTQLTLTYPDGSAVSFASSSSAAFRHCYDYAEGFCNVNGTAVTWVSGDYFFGIYDPYPQNWMEIGGQRYSVTFNSITSATLGSSGGTQNNVAFTQKMYQSNLSVLRLQGLPGGSEEAYALYNTTYGDCFLETQYAGSGNYNSIRIRTGPEYDYGYSRDHLNISPDGRLGVGKAYVDPTIGFPTQAKVHIWRESKVAAATNGSNDLRMITLDSQSVGTTPRQLAFGFRNNFNCGYIQGFQDKAGTIAGAIHLNPDGGNVKVGDGNTTYSPNTLSVGGIISHTIDNTYSFGSASYRASQVYAGTGTINTSDAREKQQVRTFSDAEKAVAASIKSKLCMFKYNDAVTKKGSAARSHAGVLAQDLISAFSAQGLDAMQYGVLCHDEWPDTYIDIPEEWAETGVLDAAGMPLMKLINPARRELVTPAGDRYGVRYEELFAFIFAAL